VVVRDCACCQLFPRPTLVFYWKRVAFSAEYWSFEELRTIRWANTLAIVRNVVCFQGRLILILLYNEACINTNNSFYVVRSPASAVESMLFVFLVYLRPLRDMIARKVLFRKANAEPNRHIFSKHDQVSSCFKSADCLRGLRAATPNSPLKMTMRNYR
jgi:hypothetical protein